MDDLEIQISLYSQYHYEAELIYQLVVANRLVKQEFTTMVNYIRNNCIDAHAYLGWLIVRHRSTYKIPLPIKYQS